MSLSASALSPRYLVTTPSNRPTELAFVYFVRFFGRFYGSKSASGTFLLWTDSLEYATSFAATKTCYGRQAAVQTREEWSAGRLIGFSRRQSVVT